MHRTAINGDKIQAYQSTSYRLGLEQPEVGLSIGKHSAPLAKLFADKGVECGAFLTAYNPRGTQQADVANDMAHAQLASKLSVLGLNVVEGSGGRE